MNFDKSTSIASHISLEINLVRQYECFQMLVNQKFGIFMRNQNNILIFWLSANWRTIEINWLTLNTNADATDDNSLFNCVIGDVTNCAKDVLQLNPIN